MSLGEVMLRLDPGEGRIATTRTFRAWEGGGEYNVARGLRRCFGLRTGIVTALADNPVGRLIEDLMLQGGVEPARLVWRAYDGIGRDVRNGLNFTERGFGVRGAVGCSDRGHSAASQLKPGDVDWEAIFGVEGVRWFHTGGVFAALSDTTRAARARSSRGGAPSRHGRLVRPQLPAVAVEGARRAGGGRGGQPRARPRTSTCCSATRRTSRPALGYEVEGMDDDLLELEVAHYEQLLERVLDELPQLALVASTLRQARTATINDWTAVCRTRSGFHVGPSLDGLEIFDRVGGGDSFASGLIYGLLEGFDVDAGARVRRRARCARDDDAGRHVDGDARGGRAPRRRRRRARDPMIVDAHQHFWDPARAEYAWMTDDVAPLRRRFGPEDLEPLLREHGVTGTVVVQARHSLDETRDLLAIAASTPFVLGVVGWVDLTGDVAAQLAEFDGRSARRHPAPRARRARSRMAPARRRAARPLGRRRGGARL